MRSFFTLLLSVQDTPSNTELLTVEATDEDDGANALVFYYLETNTVSSKIKGREGMLGLCSLLHRLCSHWSDRLESSV